MSATPAAPTAAERAATGLAARRITPLEAHAEWSPPADRDPIANLERQALNRDPDLVPIRHARMAVSPFACYRGAALTMALDLAGTPASGFDVQACGDAHLSNFGLFGSPERHLLFDVNDFDETAEAPWEWDLKRLVASIEIAARANAFKHKERRAAIVSTVREYRLTMATFATTSLLDIWYTRFSVDDMLPEFQDAIDPKTTPSVAKAIERARRHDQHQAFAKLATVAHGEHRIAPDPPLIVPLRDLAAGVSEDDLARVLTLAFDDYLASLAPQHRHLLGGYRLADFARKVVGVGSVGLQAWIALFLDRDQADPLFLQIKQAETSALEEAVGPAGFDHHGRRVVEGQHLMQSASDIFLGWARTPVVGRELDYYVRQLRDWKGSAEVEKMTPAGIELFGRMCGWTLARAHARSGDRVAISAYLGDTDAFDRALLAFAETYADQAVADHGALVDAIASGRLAAVDG